MIFWQLQMNQPDGRDGDKLDSNLMLSNKPPIIGTGEWDDYQCRYFKGEDEKGIKINDIVLVHEGKRPIALCRVISDNFLDKDFTNRFKHRNFRKVEILKFYDGLNDFPNYQGTITRLSDKEKDSYKYIKEKYYSYINAEKMDKYISLLEYKHNLILMGPPGSGKTFNAKDIAEKMIFNQISNNKTEQSRKLDNSDQFILVQFHPAYSYEDFVRGITSHIVDGLPEYKVQNKIIAEFAQKALKNLNDHKKNSSQISQEKWVENKLEEFKEFVLDELEENEKYPISKSAYIFSVDEDGFRYTGDNWANRFRIKNSEFLKLFHIGISERKEIKRNDRIKGRARQHATYFFNLLVKFREFIGDEKPPLNEGIEVPLKNFVLIIDEINRANLPAVLGELIYALEYRDCPVESMYELEDEGNSITLPSNLFIIGTMNTADRSVGHIDYAIRRRFAFVPVLPSVDVITSVVKDADVREKAVRLFTEVEKLFTLDNIAADFDPNDVQIGHSYFLAQSLKELELKLEYEIKPILREYLKDGILNKANGTGVPTEEIIKELNV